MIPVRQLKSWNAQDRVCASCPHSARKGLSWGLWDGQPLVEQSLPRIHVLVEASDLLGDVTRQALRTHELGQLGHLCVVRLLGGSRRHEDHGDRTSHQAEDQPED